MDPVKHFLYTNTSRVLDTNRLTKRKILFSNEVTGSTYLKRSVLINRFDGSYTHSDIQTENYGSSFFCDVEQPDFWDFLNSDRWNDKSILRILPGELFTALDFRLKEMLQADEISQHVTFAYLKVNSEKESEEKKYTDLSPETVRVDFTYYTRRREEEKMSFKRDYNNHEDYEDYEEIESESTISLNSGAALEKRPPSSDIVSLVNLFGEYSDLQSKSLSQIQHRMSTNMASTPAHLIGINLRHFYCPLSQEIDVDAESICSSLENEIQKGEWIINEEDTWSFGSRPTKFKTAVRVSKWVSKHRTHRKKGLSSKPSKTNLKLSEADMKENLLKPISIDIHLSVLGDIMKQEKCLKVKNMSFKERKKFCLSDERLIKVKKILKTDKMLSNHSSRRSSERKEKIKDIKNMQLFASSVLGIIDSPSVYRTLIWMWTCENGKKVKISDKLARSRLTGFSGIDEEESEEELTEQKRLSFRLRNNRSIVRTFTLHPKFFTSPTEFRCLNIKRLLRSYSEDFYRVGQKYSWEKRADDLFQYTKTRIIVPNLTSEKLEISDEMILKAIDNFIVRKEHIISSKGATLVSIAFIRPSCLNKLFF